MSKTTKRFSPEVRARAVRLVFDHEKEHRSRWAAVSSIAAKIGCTAQSLNEWVKKAEVDSGVRGGLPSDVAERLKALERENRELRQANEILRYHDHVAKRRDPSRLSVRANEALKVEVRRVFEENFRVYGVGKVWRQLRREGFDIARCTVSRLMRQMGLEGVIRGKPIRTTDIRAAF
jgi:transposase-like protein